MNPHRPPDIALTTTHLLAHHIQVLLGQHYRPLLLDTPLEEQPPLTRPYCLATLSNTTTITLILQISLLTTTIINAITSSSVLSYHWTPRTLPNILR